MPEVIGIRFKNCGKVYDFEVTGLEVKRGDHVIVESELGLSMGNVVAGPRSFETHEKELKKIIRVATEDDMKQKQGNEVFEKDARMFCHERIMARGLPMKLVCSEVTLDRKRIIFYFSADGRIDFRELVKDLAAKFKTRIEMRQIGVRDKAKMVGGLGLCGKELCCRLFLTSFEPISIKMAKKQELVLNTGKLSGICGRLMCCLGYEYGMPEAPAAETEKIEKPVVEEETVERPSRGARTSVTAGAGQEAATGAPEAVESGAGEEGPKEGEDAAVQKKKRRRRRRYRKGPKKSE